MTKHRRKARVRPLIGIDLGTTKSGVSVWDEERGAVRMLPLNESIMPSMVAWDRVERRWLVGQEAKAHGRKFPGDVIYSIKRFIGRWFRDPQVVAGQRELTYRLIPGSGLDKLCDVVVDLGRGGEDIPRLAAPEVSAMVLRKLRQEAADALGLDLADVVTAVITVPAYFNMLQRRATVHAGELAGLEVTAIINEPTAAALAYADVVLGPKERRILVYDLGGGTFDVSVLEAKRDADGYHLFTLVVDGDTSLGGDDIDTNVARFLTDQIEQRYGRSVRLDDHVTRARLRWEAELAKTALSNGESHDIHLDRLDLGVCSPFDAQLLLTRTDLEQCAADVLQRTREIAKRAVEDVAGLTWDEIDEVIMVGGQTLMPAIQRDVESFTGRKPRVNDRPQLAVALGAGEYARITSLGQEKVHEYAVTNVLALPVGIKLEEDQFKVLVNANSTVPHESQPYAVTTTEDNATFINVEILQGPRHAKWARECVLLDSIVMSVEPAPKGTLKFEVVFDVRSNGTMTVVVTDKQRNRVARKEIHDTKLVWVTENSENRVAEEAAADVS
jgi:molecular chaperone DnaK